MGTAREENPSQRSAIPDPSMTEPALCRSHAANVGATSRRSLNEFGATQKNRGASCPLCTKRGMSSWTVLTLPLFGAVGVADD